MQDYPDKNDEYSAAPNSSARIFTAATDLYNAPSKIITLGHYYPQTRIRAAKSLVKEVNPSAYRADSPYNPIIVRDHISWTRLINALKMERQWPLKRLYETLDPVLESGIAIVAVPPHRAYQAFWQMRTLAQKLAANGCMDVSA